MSNILSRIIEFNSNARVILTLKASSLFLSDEMY